jgi:RAB6A-GEF complex partner protein 2
MTPENVSHGDDTGIRVVVTPTQSSYFAGEPFSVRITITNTRSKTAAAPPVAGPSRTHKRAAHSISSAPLARPPTSPGLPRTIVQTALHPTRQDESETVQDSRRRGLIGKTQDGVSIRALAEKKRKTQPRSLSVDVQVHELPRSPLAVNVSPASPAECTHTPFMSNFSTMLTHAS